MIVPSPFATPRAISCAPCVSLPAQTTLRLRVAVSGKRSKPALRADLKARPGKPRDGRRPTKPKVTKREHDDTFFQDFVREAELMLDGASERPGVTLNSMKKLADLPRRSIDEKSAEQAMGTVIRTLEYGVRVRKKTLLLSHLGKAFQAQPALQKHAQQSPEFKDNPSKLFAVAAADKDLFSDVRWPSQLATAQVKLKYYSQDVWHRFERSGLSNLSSQAFSNVVYAAAKLHVTIGAPRPSENLQQHIWDALRHSEGGTSLVSDTKPQHLSNTVWALAKLQLMVPDDIQSSLQACATESVRSMNSQDVANTWWAFAKMGVEMQPVTNSAMQQAIARVSPVMKAEEVASALWAFAKMDVDMLPAAESALLQAVSRTVPVMKAETLTSTWWAYAERQVKLPSDLVEDLMAATAAAAPNLEPYQITIVKHAVQNLGFFLFGLSLTNRNGFTIRSQGS